MTRLNPIRILIADDHPMIRIALRSVLNSEPQMVVVGEARNGLEAIQLFRQHQPDITLMDLNMPGTDGIEAMQTILKSSPKARFIVLTNYDSEEDVHRGLKAGAMSYLIKDSPQARLLEIIRSVHAGQKHVSPDLAQKLSQRETSPKLSPRESAVLRLMKDGKSNKAIGWRLKISESTVKSHVTNILSKLGVQDRTQAVTKALQRGILQADE